MKLYAIDQLSKAAQKNAYQNWLETANENLDQIYMNTLAGFAGLFEIMLPGFEPVQFDKQKLCSLLPMNIQCLSKNELAEYLKDKYNNLFDSTKLYPLTGEYTDVFILKPMRDFVSGTTVKIHCTLFMLIGDCIEEFYDKYIKRRSADTFKLESQEKKQLYYFDGSLYNLQGIKPNKSTLVINLLKMIIGKRICSEKKRLIQTYPLEINAKVKFEMDSEDFTYYIYLHKLSDKSYFTCADTRLDDCKNRFNQWIP